jgi:hypothetical protein
MDKEKLRLLTLKDAAGLIEGLTVWRVRLLVKSGAVKSYRFGNKYMVLEKSLLDYFSK